MLTVHSKVAPFLTVGSEPLLHLTSLTFLAPYPVGSIGENLLHTGLRLNDVQLGGDEESGCPEAEY